MSCDILKDMDKLEAEHKKISSLPVEDQRKWIAERYNVPLDDIAKDNKSIHDDIYLALYSDYTEMTDLEAACLLADGIKKNFITESMIADQGDGLGNMLFQFLTMKKGL